MAKLYKSEITRRDKPSDLDAIRDYYLSEGSRNPRLLTEQQEKHRQRLVAIWTLLCEYHGEEQARTTHAKNANISDATAYRDLRDALQLFGSVRKAEKEGRRYILAEWASKTFQLAAKNGDYESMNKAVSNLIKLWGLDKEDADTPDFEKLQASPVIAVLPEQMTDMILKALGKGPMNFNQAMAEDAEYDEIITEPGSTAAQGD
jgi:hypothetical protein